MLNYIQVMTTVNKKEEAEKIGELAVREQLAACAQIIGPISSIYRWKGKIETASEWICALKTREKHYAELEGLIKKVHPYELPEIISMTINGGSSDYLAWIKKETARIK